jgi:hypothetical protein
VLCLAGGSPAARVLHRRRRRPQHLLYPHAARPSIAMLTCRWPAILQRTVARTRATTRVVPARRDWWLGSCGPIAFWSVCSPGVGHTVRYGGPIAVSTGTASSMTSSAADTGSTSSSFAASGTWPRGTRPGERTAGHRHVHGDSRRLAGHRKSAARDRSDCAAPSAGPATRPPDRYRRHLDSLASAPPRGGFELELDRLLTRVLRCDSAREVAPAGVVWPSRRRRLMRRRQL